LTKKPVVFNVHVKEYHANGVMRQFGRYQVSPLPVVHMVPLVVHK
jgi:hypothetical protein